MRAVTAIARHGAQYQATRKRSKRMARALWRATGSRKQRKRRYGNGKQRGVKRLNASVMAQRCAHRWASLNMRSAPPHRAALALLCLHRT